MIQLHRSMVASARTPHSGLTHGQARLTGKASEPDTWRRLSLNASRGAPRLCSYRQNLKISHDNRNPYKAGPPGECPAAAPGDVRGGAFHRDASGTERKAALPGNTGGTAGGPAKRILEEEPARRLFAPE